MKLLEKIGNLLPSFDAIWKIGVLAALIWIAQSLADISALLNSSENSPGVTESTSPEIFNGINRQKPQTCPRDGAVTAQDQIQI